MDINPTTITVLDVSPFDVILLVCNVTQPSQVVNITTRILWTQTSSSGMVQMLNHNGVDTNITNASLSNSMSTSTLSLYATMAGRWRFTCNASMQVPGDPVISFSQTSEVTVKGVCNNSTVIKYIVPTFIYLFIYLYLIF